MRIAVKFFAVLRDQAGLEQTSLEVKDGASVSQAVEALSERLPAIRPTLSRTAFAVNRTYVKPDARLHDGDELALIPPVSGG